MILFAQELGDVNSDNSINIVDALLIARYYVNLNPSPFNQDKADVDCNGIINIVDALLIARYYVQLVGPFSCDTPTDTPTNAPTTALTPAPTTPPSGQPLFFDDFNDGNANDWSEDRGTWSVVQVAWIGTGRSMAFSAGDQARQAHQLTQ
jgi:hypothetical protein